MRLVHERAPEGFDHINDVSAPRKSPGHQRLSTNRWLKQSLSSGMSLIEQLLPKCRSNGRFVTRPSPRRLHSSSVHGARNWVVTKSDVHRTMSIQGRSALLTSVNALKGSDVFHRELHLTLVTVTPREFFWAPHITKSLLEVDDPVENLTNAPTCEEAEPPAVNRARCFRIWSIDDAASAGRGDTTLS